MRKFRFSLETALAMRERAVTSAEEALRSAQARWADHQRRRQELESELAEAQSAVQRVHVDAAELVALDRFRSAVQRRRRLLDQEGTALLNQLAARKVDWQKAERDRTLLLRLKEKALSLWQSEYEKEQQQMAEEAFLSRWKSR